MSTERPRRVLLVASAGGHLAQLLQMRSCFADYDRTWVTFDGASLDVGDDRVIYCHHPTTRNVKNLVRNFALAIKTVRRTDYDLVVSTGAGAAIPFFAAGRLRGAKTVFVEVVDRIDSATLTGKLARPLVHDFLVQWPEQLQVYPHATVIGPLYHTDAPARTEPTRASADRESGKPANVFVTVGTDHHPFSRLVDLADGLTMSDRYSVTVQHGASVAPSRAGGLQFIDAADMRQRFAHADVVICHGGPSTIIEAMAFGHRPIVVPRNPNLGEHVDDHQLRFAQHMNTLGGIELVHAGADALAEAVGTVVAAGVGEKRAMDAPPATLEALHRRIDALGGRTNP